MSGQDELQQLLAEWREELDGREARLAVFCRKGDQLNYQLEYARISVLRRCIGTLADVLATTSLPHP